MTATTAGHPIPERTLSELTQRLVLAGWPRLVVNDDGLVDLNKRPADRGCWLLDDALDGDRQMLSIHCPTAWGVIKNEPFSATVEVTPDEQLGSVVVWLQPAEHIEQEETVFADLRYWPGLAAIEQLTRGLAGGMPKQIGTW